MDGEVTRIYDKPHDGKLWPKWWEEYGDPDSMGNVCVLCQREFGFHLGINAHVFASGMNENRMDDSGFSVCVPCVYRIGARPQYNTIDSHDRGMMQRFSAVYRTFKEEIKWQKSQAQRAYFPSASTSTN